jgi:hypothetical protein
MTRGARLALLVGAPAAAAAAIWLATGRGGSPGDVGRVEIRDVLVTRDGAPHTGGSLEGCDATGCELGERRFERSELAFIGLGVEDTTPPPVEDPERDELRLRQGGVEHERLARIDEDAVFAGARRFERGQVSWIYLALQREPPQPEAATEAPSERETDEPSPPPPPPPPRQETADSGQRRLPPPREPREAPFEGCPDDEPLGAWIWLRNDFHDVLEPNCMGTETHVVRFRLEAEPGTIAPGRHVALGYQAKELHYSVFTSGCFDTPHDPYTVCNAEGASLEGTVSLSPENLGSAAFFPLNPTLSFQYPKEVNPPVSLDVQCLHQPTGSRSTGKAWGFGGIQIDPGECGYPHHACDSYCVAPTVCKDSSTAPPGCFQNTDEYAVIPFEGALVDGPDREQRGLCTYPGSSQVRWRVCCGCAETGPPPDFAPRAQDDPCQNAASELAGLVGRLRGLAEAYRYHERDFRCAEGRRDQWRDRIWGIGGSLAGFSATLPGTAPNAPRYQTFTALLPALQRILSGDDSALSQAETAIDVAANDDVMNTAQSGALAMLRQAFRTWNEYVSRGANLREAARAYKAQLRHIKEAFGDIRRAGKALQPVTGLVDMAFAASKLADDIRGYAEWRQEAERERAAMEEAQDGMRDLQAQIDLLRARCPDLPPPPHQEPAPMPEGSCPERPTGSVGMEPSAPWTPSLAGATTSDFQLAATGSASSETELAGLNESFRSLAAIEERAVARSADEILPLLAPFLFHQAAELPVELRLELLREAAPHLQALQGDIDEAVRLASEIENVAKRAEPAQENVDTASLAARESPDPFWWRHR